MKVVFLGTSGSIPTAERNLPAIALRMDRELLLFDCAEGTQRQMVRAGVSPMRLKAVFLTHFHGDHFLGLSGLVQTLALMNRTDELEVYGPPGTSELVEKFLGLGYYKLTFKVQAHDMEPGGKLRREGYTIKTCEVEHSVQGLAYAVVEDPRPGKFYPEKAIALGVETGPDFSRLRSGQSIEFASGQVVKPEQVMGLPRPGRKIVYAGDSRPCEQVVELAQDADLLIHDCSFANELLDKAIESGHSTPWEAAEIAKKAKVKQLVLTHISPRYADDSLLLEEARQIFQNVVVARDMMELEVQRED